MKAWLNGIASQLEYIKLGLHDMYKDPRVQAGTSKNQKLFARQRKRIRAKTGDDYEDAKDEKLDKVGEFCFLSIICWLCGNGGSLCYIWEGGPRYLTHCADGWCYSSRRNCCGVKEVLISIRLFCSS